MHLPALQKLALHRVHMQGDAVSVLAHLPGVRELHVDRCLSIDASCLQALPSLTQLQDLLLDAQDCPKIQVLVVGAHFSSLRVFLMVPWCV